MKLVTFEYNGQTQIGALDGDSVIKFPAASAVPPTMLELLEAGDAGMAVAQAAINAAGDADRIPSSEVSFHSPVPNPTKVIALGRNYAAHAKEGGAEPPDFPMIFHKTSTSLNGAGQPVVIPEGTDKVDYEAELAVIIGRTCKNVSEEDALSYVAGYATSNDITARDWQRRTSQFSAGKMVDTFGPVGPALVTADEIPDPQNLTLKTYHNGNLMQDGHTRDMIFSVAFTIAYLSRITTLNPGDIIMTGTPEGVGYARKPPVYMQVGDDIVIDIEGVGRLENHFVAAA